MNRLASRIAGFAALALAFTLASTLTSCGSGGVSGPAQVNDPSRITVLPATATAYSGLPTTFVISGGTGSYIVSSDNQAVIPVAGSINGSSLTVLPNPVLADTTVRITVRDTGTTPLATATVTVRPGTVANNITITPSSTQGGSCDPAVCSGGDALVTATLSQGGVPLPARGVRFEVVSGDFRFITSLAGAPETLDTQVTVVTDQAGKASARIRALADAPNQTALLQVTDLGTGAFQRASFVIAQATGTSPGFFITPDKVVFQGARTDQCASSGISATFFVFGGSPPYTVASTSSAFFVSRDFVAFSGGSFSIAPNGTCVAEPGAPIVVRDSSGRTVTALAANVPGTQSVPSLVVGPTTVTINSCSATASVTAVGGTGHYIGTLSNTSSLTFSQSGNTFTVQRLSSSPALASPQTLSISDGTSVQSVTINLTGEGAGVCPALIATPSTVNLTCGASANITLSGGTAPYTAAADKVCVSTSVVGSTLTITRLTAVSPATCNLPSGSTPPWFVTVSDASTPTRGTTVTVNAPANCP